MKKIQEIRGEIQQRNPLIHCITNVVTVNDCANVLLAVGASPTMAHHPLEVEEIASHCDALVLNMGAMESYDAMLLAGKAAKKAGIPIVLDPVGASGATYRREQTMELMRQVSPDCIRGNLSEIRALATGVATSMGVDAAPNEKVDLEQLHFLSEKTGAIIIASGKTDYLVKGKQQIAVEGGSLLMSKITGTGCMSSALLGAFLAVSPGMDSAAACVKMVSLCAGWAEKQTLTRDGGTMMFHDLLIDAIYKNKY